MAGGIYPGRPFSLNAKCIVFSALTAGGYWFLPPKNVFVLLFLLWSSYLAVAWYDFSYNCQDRLQPTVVPFGRFLWLPFKPPDYQADFRKMAQAQIDVMDTVDHLTTFTLMVAAIGYLGWQLTKK